MDASVIKEMIRHAAMDAGVDPDALIAIATIESSLNPAAKNPKSSAGGLFQFIDSTAKAYRLADRFDPLQAAIAGAQLARDNADYISKKLARPPLPGELYLAHQQGAGGAVKLLSRPDALACDVVGARAVTLNGGRLDMTCAEFAALWTGKLDRVLAKVRADG